MRVKTFCFAGVARKTLRRRCLWIFLLPVVFQPVYASVIATKLFHLDGGLQQPTDMAVSKKGRVYVLDGVNHRVVVFSPEGEQEATLVEGGVLLKPMGLALYDHQLYIADSGNHQIVVITLRDGGVRRLTLKGPLPSEPVAITVNEDAITWSDRANHRVCRNALETGARLNCWGTRGRNKGAFDFPFQVKTDADHYVYAVDVLNGRVQVFNHRGRYFTQLGRFGLGSGELYRPNGLAIYRHNIVLVSDAYRGSVSMFKEGRFIGLLKNHKGNALRFDAPVGLSVSGNRLYVADPRRGRVEVFQLEMADSVALRAPVSVSEHGRAQTSQKNCGICHLSWTPGYRGEEGVQDGVQPVATERMCYSCHHGAVVDSRKITGQGQQHPNAHHRRDLIQQAPLIVGEVKGRASKEGKSKPKPKPKPKPKEMIPKEFPLLPGARLPDRLPEHLLPQRPHGMKTSAESVTNLDSGNRLSCGSCHTPHTPNETKVETLYPQHENAWMRVPNIEGDLCVQCHTSKQTGSDIQGASKEPSPQREPTTSGDKSATRSAEAASATPLKLGAEPGVNHPVGIYLKAPPAQDQNSDSNHYARSKTLHQGLPESLLFQGAALGSEKQLICQSCHQIHGAENEALTVLGFKEGQLCIECHEGHTANTLEEARQKGIHPVNIELPSAVTIAGQAVNKVTCLTCHSVHDGRPGSSNLKIEAQEGQLCRACHEGYDEVVGSDHDLRVSADKAENRLGQTPQQSGVCGACHTMHQGRGRAPLLYAGESQSIHADSSVPGRDGICLDCHQEKGRGSAVVVEHFRHPSETLILRSDPKVMPLFDVTEHPNEFGAIACATCHDPHRWVRRGEEDTERSARPEGLDAEGGNSLEHVSSKASERHYQRENSSDRGDGSEIDSAVASMNQKGNVLNSFLRVSGTQGTFCVSCHGLEAQIKFQYYHDEVARNNGAEHFYSEE